MLDIITALGDFGALLSLAYNETCFVQGAEGRKVVSASEERPNEKARDGWPCALHLLSCLTV